jgi:hypothetical protein
VFFYTGDNWSNFVSVAGRVSGICSKPAFGSLSDHAQYKWTSCICITIVEEYLDLVRRADMIKGLQLVLGDFSRINELDIQHFVLTFSKQLTGQVKSRLEYTCRQCILDSKGKLRQSTNVDRLSVNCQSTKCRQEMENVVEAEMQVSGNIVCDLVSDISPFEDLDHFEQRIRNRRNRIVNPVLILPQNIAFLGLARMSVRDNYFNHRSRINFIRMNQAILSENISQNVSALFKFPNSGIRDFNPTGSTKGYDAYFLLNKTVFENTVPTLTYGNTASLISSYTSMYVTGEGSFNFLTCHGFHKVASLTVYFGPFDLWIWMTVLVAMFCITIILTVTYFSFSCSSSNSISLKLILTVLSEAVELIFYALSVLLENGFQKLQFPRLSESVAKVAFITLAFMCVILGNLYKSIVTTDMITETTGTIPYETFKQLMHNNFNLIVVPSSDMRLKQGFAANNLSQSEVAKGEDGIAVFEKYELEHSYCDLVAYLYLILYRTYQFPFGFSEEILALKNGIESKLRLFGYEEDALVALATCQKKAFVGSVEEISDFIKFNRNRISLLRGKEKFLPHGKVWGIPYFAGGYVHRRMSQLISSGIYFMWEQTFYAKTRDELDISLKKTIEVKQSLDTNLGALFRIVALFWAFGFAMLCIELLLSILTLNFLHRIFSYIRQFIVKAIQAYILSLAKSQFYLYFATMRIRTNNNVNTRGKGNKAGRRDSVG